MENGNSCSFKVVMAVSCIVFFLFSGRMHASQSSEIQMQGGVRASGGSEGHEISIGEWVLAGNKKRYIGFSDGVVRRGFGFEISDGVAIFEESQDDPGRLRLAFDKRTGMVRVSAVGGDFGKLYSGFSVMDLLKIDSPMQTVFGDSPSSGLMIMTLRRRAIIGHFEDRVPVGNFGEIMVDGGDDPDMPYSVWVNYVSGKSLEDRAGICVNLTLVRVFSCRFNASGEKIRSQLIFESDSPF